MRISIILAVSFVTGLYGCRTSSQNSPDSFYANYHFTAEATYIKIEIDHSKLVYTYFADTANKCQQWVAQTPCWTFSDLRTKEAALTGEEIKAIEDVALNSNFMKLDSVCGGAAENQRYYPYVLHIKTGETGNKIIYQNFPGGKAEPEAFSKVKNTLFELVKKKFGQIL